MRHTPHAGMDLECAEDMTKLCGHDHRDQRRLISCLHAHQVRLYATCCPTHSSRRATHILGLVSVNSKLECRWPGSEGEFQLGCGQGVWVRLWLKRGWVRLNHSLQTLSSAGARQETSRGRPYRVRRRCRRRGREQAGRLQAEHRRPGARLPAWHMAMDCVTV